jgi:hypothetical protein
MTGAVSIQLSPMNIHQRRGLRSGYIFDLTKGNFKHETKHLVQQSNLSVSPAAGECSWVIIEWILAFCKIENI